MKKYLKSIKRKILKSNYYRRLVAFQNYYNDLELFLKYSNVFNVDNLNKKEAKVILDYHALEKGMLFLNMKQGYGKERVLRLHQNLDDHEVVKNIGRTQIRIAYQVMCKYYELHQDNGMDISEFYSKSQYDKYRFVLKDLYSERFEGVVTHTRDSFYGDINKNFKSFAHSRKSTRNYTGELIDKELIEKAVELALTSPSVCNRQASKVYLIEDKDLIDKILLVQGGFKGYSENVYQLLILTNDRNYYYTVGERNQLYVDGGIFLMNLLYSLHFHKIGNCPANWAKTKKQEESLDKILHIPKSEKIICTIPIGRVIDEFRVTLSKRRDLEEVFRTLK